MAREDWGGGAAGSARNRARARARARLRADSPRHCELQKTLAEESFGLGENSLAALAEEAEEAEEAPGLEETSTPLKVEPIAIEELQARLGSG